MKHPKQVRTRTEFLPSYLGSKMYSERHEQYSDRRLSLEIYQRQSLYKNIQNFKKYMKDPTILFRSYWPGVRITQFTQEYITNQLNGDSNITVEKSKEIEGLFYLEEIKRLSNEFTQQTLLDDDLEAILSEKENWDSRPYIKPARFLDSESQSLFDASYNILREPFESPEKDKNILSIIIDLDFSPSVIKNSVEQLAKYEQSRISYKHQLSQSKDFIIKLRRYKIIQLMDIHLWLELVCEYIHHKELELFLYPRTMFLNDKFSDEVIPLMKELFDQKSKRSKFLFYLADRK